VIGRSWLLQQIAQGMQRTVKVVSAPPATVLAMTTTHLTEDQQDALTEARSTAAALHARVAAGRTGSSDDAAEAVIADALAASAALVDAVPALADRHQTWLGRFAQTTGQQAWRRALAAPNHIGLLARAGRRPVVVTAPGSRFAGDLDEAEVRP